MRFVALISGGKDSIYALTRCVEDGHKPVCLGNLHPKIMYGELNSYMYQSVGSEMIEGIAQCLGLPLIRQEIQGIPVELGIEYTGTEKDEVEDLYTLLKKVIERFPEIEGVSSGAIFSTYQKNRVEKICDRLGLKSMAPLWQRNQIELLTEMVENKIGAVLIRVGSFGLKEKHLGKPIAELKDYLISLQQKYDCQCCGEGGEFESLVLDAPIFKRAIKIIEAKVIVEKEDSVQFVGHLAILKYELVDKFS